MLEHAQNSQALVLIPTFSGGAHELSYELDAMIRRRGLTESAKATAVGLDTSGRNRGNASRADWTASPIFLGYLRISNFIEVHWRFGDEEAWVRLVKSFNPSFFVWRTSKSHLALAFAWRKPLSLTSFLHGDGCVSATYRQPSKCCCLMSGYFWLPKRSVRLVKDQSLAHERTVLNSTGATRWLADSAAAYHR